MKTIVTEQFLIENCFEKESSIGWNKFRKGVFELVEIPLRNGGFVIGFDYNFKSRPKYKYPITMEELECLYKIITGSAL